ncbi:MAG: tryptophan-rich sensory protein [Simkaniaceae bacterium]|nr:MAG: tryptophan-rich sensory protein [Simkaniaceae bacterium]
MYTKKQKVEIFFIFLLTVLAIELFTIFISEKRIFELFNTQRENLPWAMPIWYMLLVWTGIFILIGASGSIIWTKRATHIRNFAMWAWVVQLILNVLWPICFFYVPIAVLTPILITLLFMTLLVLMFYSFLVSRLAALLIVPYFLMVVYKMLFHWVFYILNIKLL